MDLDKYINENYDTIIDDITNNKLDKFDDIHEIINETYINELYLKKLEEESEIKINESDDDQVDYINNNTGDDMDTDYYVDILNMYTMYYNKKYCKTNNFFTNVENDNETNDMQELFYDAMLEYQQVKKIFNEDLYYNHTDFDKVNKLYDEYNEQIYCLEINKTKIISASLIVCLCYVINNNYKDINWRIFHTRNF